MRPTQTDRRSRRRQIEAKFRDLFARPCQANAEPLKALMTEYFQPIPGDPDPVGTFDRRLAKMEAQQPKEMRELVDRSVAAMIAEAEQRRLLAQQHQ